MKPTSPKTIAKINKMFNELQEDIEYLYARWQDEKDYEDIEEYGMVIKSKLSKEFTFVGMMGYPKFGFSFSIEGNTYWMGCDGAITEWKRTS